MESGADRDRTGNLLVANQALSQLSYGPENIAANILQPTVAKHKAATKGRASVRDPRSRLYA